MLRTIGQCVPAMVLCAGMAAVAVAQQDDAGTVNGQGMVTLRPKPTHLRAQMQLRAQGKTVEQALERLKARREEAIAKLKTLKADEGSVSSGNPSIYKGPWPYYGVPMAYGVPAAVTAPAQQPYLPPTYAPSTNTGPSYGVPTPAPPALSPSPYTPSTPANPVPSPLVPGVSLPGLTPSPPSESDPPRPTPITPPPSALPSTPPPSWDPYTPRPSFATPAAPPAVQMPSTPPMLMPPTPPTVAPPTSPPTFVTASMTLAAQWRLEGETLEQILIAAESLQERIAIADVPGNRAATPLPSEEREPAEQGNTSGAYPGTPLNMPVPYYAPPTQSCTSAAGPFVYVAKLSDSERKKALAEAFEQAKRQAAELAEAAGSGLGSIASLDRESGPYIVDLPTYNSPGYSFPTAVGSDQNEAVAASPDALAFAVRVRVSFHLLPGPR
jgi:uncharacterized protein YggE